MGRAWRIEFDGAFYHVLSRGNEGRNIFFDDTDRRKFLDTAGEMSHRFSIDIFAYALMDNHYHLLLTTARGNITRAMQWFGTTYTRRFNNRHTRSGHLFQGRYKSLVIENDAYLSQLSCYIHRNPLRAGIVKRLAAYRWSSYLVYAYGKPGPPWLRTELILSLFGGKDPHRLYRQKVQQYAQEEKHLWEDLRHGTFLGSKAFVDHMRKRYLPERPSKEIQAQRRLTVSLDIDAAIDSAAALLGFDYAHLRKSPRITGLEKQNRDTVLYWLWQTGAFTNEEIAAKFGLTYSSVSHSVRWIKSKLQRRPELLTKFELLNSQFKV